LVFRDGYSWTPKDGLIAGVPSPRAISLLSKTSSTGVLYDVLVIVAGYCGLTAASNMTVEGLEVLLPEGCDRIGGYL